MIFLSAAVMIAGCNPDNQVRAVDPNFESPAFRKAREKGELRDYAGALALYEESVRDNPALARAHFEMGMIFDDKLGDYVSAIYHYKKYLKLQPNGDKAKVVEQWIPRAELAFASMQPNSPIQSADELARLQRENLVLKQQMEEGRKASDDLQKQITDAQARLQSSEQALAAANQRVIQAQQQAAAAASSRGGDPATPPPAQLVETTSPPAGTPHPSPSSSGAKEHVVQSGDTLWKIAAKHYPGRVKEGVDLITQANKDTLPDPAKLKLGQTLLIP